MHSFSADALLRTFTLLSTGSNAGGQLGHSFPYDAHVFRACQTSSSHTVFPPRSTEQILDLALGANHTVALLSVRNTTGQSVNEVWGAGNTDHGQLGLSVAGTTSVQGFRKLQLPSFGFSGVSIDLTRYEPTLIASSFNTTFIAYSALFHLSASANMSEPRSLLLAMGSNDVSVLGNGTGSQTSGTYAWHVFPNEDIHMISSSPRSVVLVLVNQKSGVRKQRVLGWGGARQGQLGPIYGSPSVPVVASPRTSKSRSRMKSASSSATSQSSTLDQPTPLCLPNCHEVQAVSTGMSHTIYLTTSNPPELVFQGGAALQPPPSISEIGHIKQVQSTWSAIFVLVDPHNSPASDSKEVPVHLKIYGWGKARNGQLGPDLETPASIVYPTPSPPIESFHAGSAHLLSLHRSDQTGQAEIWGWGWNEHGNLGDGHTQDRSKPIRVWPAYLDSSRGERDIQVDHSDLKEGQETRWQFVGDGQVERCWAGNGTSWVLLRNLPEESPISEPLTNMGI